LDVKRFPLFQRGLERGFPGRAEYSPLTGKGYSKYDGTRIHDPKERSAGRLFSFMAEPFPLQVINLAQARYECTYGRGCDGICCKEGRPLVYPEEVDRLKANLEKFWPFLRPEARNLIEKKGFLTDRRRLNEQTVRAVGGWCTFFNQGCVLHKIGAEEGDKFKYKPAVCALFPIQQDDLDRWYIRQRGYKKEKWDLFCLDPASTAVPAAESLQEEIALARRFAEEDALAARPAPTLDKNEKRRESI
jgi:hypothetical protein